MAEPTNSTSNEVAVPQCYTVTFGEETFFVPAPPKISFFDTDYRTCYYCGRDTEQIQSTKAAQSLEAVVSPDRDEKANCLIDLHSKWGTPDCLDETINRSTWSESSWTDDIPSSYHIRLWICTQCRDYIEGITIRFKPNKSAKMFSTVDLCLRIQKSRIDRDNMHVRGAMSNTKDKFLNPVELYFVLASDPVIDVQGAPHEPCATVMHSGDDADQDRFETLVTILQEALIDESQLNPYLMTRWVTRRQDAIDDGRLKLLHKLAEYQKRLVELIQVHLPKDLALLVAEYFSHVPRFLKVATRCKYLK